MADAKAQFVDAMERDPADRGLDHATQQAVKAVSGLVADGPVRLVTDKLTPLGQEAENAQRAAEGWERTANRIDAQFEAHRAEDDEDAALLRRAEEEAVSVQSEVAELLTVQAKADGAAYLAAVESEAAASWWLATLSRFGRRKARAELREANEHARTVRAQVREKWGKPPRTADALPEWAAQRAESRADADPRVIDGAQKVEPARTDRDAMRQRLERERRALLVREYGAKQAQLAHLGMRTQPAPRGARRQDPGRHAPRRGRRTPRPARERCRLAD